ncbi:hypothetical protein RHMOL_Rhmol01G0137700 [Rhododendron molle]|uniref:Uncharacterized protein n=1 Tax=Rhododendron molle TaxID=49168 RepID=A0ACC0Q1T3_RHOML|nr:hypothetical protein RHMOL_Rhmol01G0137700 [Rhododendron molle]
MAMAGRLRSTLPLFSRIVRSNSFSTIQRSTVQRFLLCLSFADPQFLKSYASASPPKEQKVKATALYIAAAKANALEKVESELLDVVEASNKSTTFSMFMKDLSVPADTRIKAITEICAEAKFSDLTRNFLVVLAENGRLKHLESIVKRFTELTMAHRGEMKAIVTTVIEMKKTWTASSSFPAVKKPYSFLYVRKPFLDL